MDVMNMTFYVCMLLFWLSVASCWCVFPEETDVSACCCWCVVVRLWTVCFLRGCEVPVVTLMLVWLWRWALFLVSVICPGFLFSELPVHISCPFLFWTSLSIFVDILCILAYKSLAVVMLCDYFLPFLGSSTLWIFFPPLVVLKFSV